MQKQVLVKNRSGKGRFTFEMFSWGLVGKLGEEKVNPESVPAS